MKRLLSLLLALTACTSHPTKPTPHDTAALDHNLSVARSSLADADASTGRAQGHIKAARDDASRVDAKASVIEGWIKKQ